MIYHDLPIERGDFRYVTESVLQWIPGLEYLR